MFFFSNLTFIWQIICYVFAQFYYLLNEKETLSQYFKYVKPI